MNSRYERKQQGLSLVELMVAMALGLLLVLGTAKIFTSNKAVYRVQDGMARIQESGRFAMQRIGASLRTAGFFGCAGLYLLTPNVIANSPPSDFSSITTGTPINGLDDVATGNSFNAAAGTDVITVRGTGYRGEVGLTGSTTSSGAPIQVVNGYSDYAVNALLLITDCATGDLFRATNVSTSVGTTSIEHTTAKNASNSLSKSYGADALVLKPFIHSYFVRNSGRDNSQGDDIMSLYLRDISGTDYELAEGVSDLQILYGVDADANRAADVYMDASTLTAAGDWDKVMSARISLLVDSIDDVLQESATYTFAGTSTTPSDKRLRQEFTGLFVIRNRTL